MDDSTPDMVRYPEVVVNGGGVLPTDLFDYRGLAHFCPTLFRWLFLLMNIFIIFAKTGSKTDRGQTIYTRKRSTHDNKITKMPTNIEHSPERLTRHCKWHQIFDKTQI